MASLWVQDLLRRKTRDARLPLPSINPKFENLIQTDSNRDQEQDYDHDHDENDQIRRRTIKKSLPSRLIVYKIVKSKYHSTGPLTSSNHDGHEEFVKSKNHHRNQSDSLSQGFRIMVCGMPNVGKPSLLNALTRVGCQEEAPMPGYTRSIGGIVKILEPFLKRHGKSVYMIDTPGIMPIYLGQGDEASARAFEIPITDSLKVNQKQDVSKTRLAASSCQPSGVALIVRSWNGCIDQFIWCIFQARRRYTPQSLISISYQITIQLKEILILLIHARLTVMASHNIETMGIQQGQMKLKKSDLHMIIKTNVFVTSILWHHKIT
ncbi:uncharacterized protein MELLADRAFT_113929 [Melampsora larici-populina 98AG31]|uniref:G domain-containing protein n=1 Tax=Melampsora larici-populina (strain 98AG31 / pathotype 3-4-7) TaxID=747676 RepID=F4SBJ3_MELLP|nr:uncharacterized protein MELLADRAFT_113929 [Melampsora larici-populina 98AG31]EGF97985.1 hypothetical protein MELLADRAFT_113929 [Melampsora larici-populina 98AG31]